MFLRCCKNKEKVVPTNYDKVEDMRSTPFKKDKMASQTNLGENPDELEVTWRMLSLMLDRLCLYVYTITMAILIVVFMLALLGVV